MKFTDFLPTGRNHHSVSRISRVAGDISRSHLVKIRKSLKYENIGKSWKVGNAWNYWFYENEIFMILTSQNHVKTKQNSAFCEVSDFMRNFRIFYENSMFLSWKVKFFIKIFFTSKIILSPYLVATEKLDLLIFTQNQKITKFLEIQWNSPEFRYFHQNSYFSAHGPKTMRILTFSGSRNGENT